MIRWALLPVGVALVLNAGCGAGAGQNAATPALEARIDSVVAESMRDGKVPGLGVVVVQGDQILVAKGYGVADVAAQRPMTDSTPVIIGSTTKTLAALAVMQLAESGKVALDTPVVRYLPELHFRDPRGARVTLRQLLTNTAGLEHGYWGDPAAADPAADSGALGRMVSRRVAMDTLQFTPGTGYLYSNLGFAIAGRVVEKLAGQSFESYAASHIFAPLGMTHSTVEYWRGAAIGMAQGYTARTGGGTLPAPPTTLRGYSASGMSASTARDVGRYLVALLNHGRGVTGKSVLSPAGVSELLRAQAAARGEIEGDTLHYALGWEVSSAFGTTKLQKGGSVGTMGSSFYLLPEKRLGIGLLFNAIDYGKVQLAPNIARVVLGLATTPYRSLPDPPAPPPPSPFTPDRRRWARLVGTYDTNEDFVVVAQRGDTLTATISGIPSSLEATSDTTFLLRSLAADHNGRLVTFRLLRGTTTIEIKDRLLGSITGPKLAIAPVGSPPP